MEIATSMKRIASFIHNALNFIKKESKNKVNSIITKYGGDINHPKTRPLMKAKDISSKQKEKEENTL